MEVVVIVVGCTVLVLVVLLFDVLEIASKVGKRRALQTFVPVEAVVVSQKMLDDNTGDGITWYRPAIEYEYDVEGRIYRSEIIWSGTSGVRSVYHFSRKKARHLLDQYPVGQTVPAFRDPADPTQAFLIRKHPFLQEHLLTLFLGGFGLLIVFGYAFGFALEAGILWELIGGIGLSSVLIAAWFGWRARQANRNEEKN